MHFEYCWTPGDVARHVQYVAGILGQAPAPQPPSGAPGFPLPAGYYYGPKSGPNNCISGMAGEQPAWIEGLKQGQRQLMVRIPGCLPRWGADGKYGATYAGETYEAVRRFQTQARIAVDGLLGRVTWGKLFS
jgi:peptidoglycan hydrolase-like protein with peptidoglycan-binding domain